MLHSLYHDGDHSGNRSRRTYCIAMETTATRTVSTVNGNRQKSHLLHRDEDHCNPQIESITKPYLRAMCVYTLATRFLHRIVVELRRGADHTLNTRSTSTSGGRIRRCRVHRYHPAVRQSAYLHYLYMLCPAM